VERRERRTVRHWRGIGGRCVSVTVARVAGGIRFHDISVCQSGGPGAEGWRPERRRCPVAEPGTESRQPGVDRDLLQSRAKRTEQEGFYTVGRRMSDIVHGLEGRRSGRTCTMADFR